MSTLDEVRRVGFVGLGNMGLPMSRHLAAAGLELVVRDNDLARQEEAAAELGCEAASTPEDFATVDAVITMLPTGQIVRDVLLGWQGGLLRALAPGTVVIDMSSSEPTGTRELGVALADSGVALVNAPVSGGTKGATAATLSIMIGGDDESAIAHARPLLEILGGRLFSTGPLGSGHAMKALNNYMSAVGAAASAEALLVGAAFGLDPTTMVNVLNASSGRNETTEVLLKPHVLTRAFSTGFTLALLAKDVGIAAGLAEAVGIEAPLCQLTKRLWTEAAEGEEPDADFMSVIRYWEKMNGTELPSTLSTQE